MENVVSLIETISGFIWGGTWGDTRLLPVGPLAIVLLGTGIFMMIRLGGRPLGLARSPGAQAPCVR